MRLGANDRNKIRLRIKFLWLPKKLKGEWRWLEHARVAQKWSSKMAMIPDTHGHVVWYWRDIEWKD